MQRTSTRRQAPAMKQAKPKLQPTKSTSSHTLHTKTRQSSIQKLHSTTISNTSILPITPHTVVSHAGASTHINPAQAQQRPYLSLRTKLNKYKRSPSSSSLSSPSFSSASIASLNSTPLSPFNNRVIQIQNAGIFTHRTIGLPQHFKKRSSLLTSSAFPSADPYTTHSAPFFTDLSKKLKSFMGFDDNTNTQTTATQQQQDPHPSNDNNNYQLSFHLLPPKNQRDIGNVMARFKEFVDARSGAAHGAPITTQDKEQFVKEMVSMDELESLQYDSGSQSFFMLPKPTKPLSTQAFVQMSHGNNDTTTASSPRRATIDRNSKDYDEMLQNNMKRYHEGELNAKMELRRAQMIKDSLDNDVLHLDLDDLVEKQAHELEQIQNKYENNPHFDPSFYHNETSHQPTELKLIQNPDGSISFKSANDTTSTTAPNNQNAELLSKAQSTAAAMAENDKKIQVPVDGTPTAIGQIADPRLLLSFICDMCNTRNVKSIPKRSYERGVVLIRCECSADHLIADNLGWFDDSGPLRLDRIMKEDKNQDIMTVSVLDTNKPVRSMYDPSLPMEDAGSHIGKEHITPEMLEKINSTLKIARELDEKKGIQFKHFHQQDINSDLLDKQFGQVGTLPMLPAGKINKPSPTSLSSPECLKL